VFVHEMGHFLVARWCGVTVKAFSIGFGPELWATTDSKGTRWRIAAIPLGGYVKFLDDANAASAPSGTALESLTPEERRGAFQLKPVWQRAAVVFAGPFANFILAAVIYTALNLIVGVRTAAPVVDLVLPNTPAAAAGIKAGDRVLSIDGETVREFGDILEIVLSNPGKTMILDIDRAGQRLTIPVTALTREHKDSLGVTMKTGELGIRSALPPTIGEVVPELPAARAGFKVGDVVRSIDGREIQTFDEVADIINKSPGKALTVSVLRNGAATELPVTPVSKPAQKVTGEMTCIGRIGIGPAATEPRPVGFGEALSRGISSTGAMLVQTYRGLRDIFVGHQSIDQVGGPILMAQVTARAVSYGWEELFALMAVFSANIGLLNLLPVPLLDGGHLVFYAIEAIRRRPLTPAVQEACFRFGLAVVLTIMLVAFSNDFSRVGRKLGVFADEPPQAQPNC
jgi:regulator of sigma E protease